MVVLISLGLLAVSEKLPHNIFSLKGDSALLPILGKGLTMSFRFMGSL